MVYRNKDCAIFYGKTNYSNVTYELSDCRTEINENIIPVQSCYLTIVNASYQNIITRMTGLANCSVHIMRKYYAQYLLSH